MPDSKDEISQLHDSLITKPQGMRYYKVNFHLHSPVLKDDWKERTPIDENVTVQDFIQSCIDLNYDIIFVADHNYSIIDFIKSYQKIPEGLKNAITVFPCCETKFTTGEHIQIVFHPNIMPDRLKTILNKIGISETWNEGIEDKFFPDKNFYTKILKYAEFIFFPHANLEHGILYENKGIPTIKQLFKNPPFRIINLPSEPIPVKHTNKNPLSHVNCGNMNNKMFFYNFGYPDFVDTTSLGKIKCSDTHSISRLKKMTNDCPICSHRDLCHYGPNWIKLAKIAKEGFNQLFYDQETRILNQPPEPIDFGFLLGIHVEKGFFNNEFFRFHPHLNVVLGSRGSGKSLLFEILQFAIDSYPEWDKNDSLENQWLSIEYLSKLEANLPIKSKVTIFYQDENGEIWAIQRYVNQYPDIDKLKSSSNRTVERELKIFQPSKQEIYRRINGMFELFPDFPQKRFQILNQIKITHLATFEMQKLLKYYDDYLFGLNIRFQEEKNKEISYINQIKRNREKLIKNYENLGILKSIDFKIRDAEKEINQLRKYQSNIKMLGHNQWVDLKSQVNQLDKIVKEINDYIKNLKKTEKTIKKLEKNWKEKEFAINTPMKDLFTEMRWFLSKIKDYIKNWTQKQYSDITKSHTNEKYEEIQKEWEKLFQNHDTEYRNITNHTDSSIDSKITSLKSEIDGLTKQKSKFDGILQEIIDDEQKYINLIQKYHESKIEISKIRTQSVENFNNNYANRKERISIKIKGKNIALYEDFLGKLGSGKKIPSFLLNISPLDLILCMLDLNDGIEFIEILEENYGTMPSDEKRLKIYEIIENIGNPTISDTIIYQKFHENIKNNSLYIESTKYLNDFLNSNEIQNFHQKYFEFPLVDVPDKILLYIERGGRSYLLENGSMGEKISSVLSFLLQDQYQVLLIDQPDTELDFKSIETLVQSILNTKRKRQLIFITHNPNIPVLGDAEQIIFLEKNQEKFDGEQGLIKETGGFEKMIDLILQVEGGPKAIQNRTKKYGGIGKIKGN